MKKLIVFGLMSILAFVSIGAFALNEQKDADDKEKFTQVVMDVIQSPDVASQTLFELNAKPAFGTTINLQNNENIIRILRNYQMGIMRMPRQGLGTDYYYFKPDIGNHFGINKRKVFS